MQYSIFIFVFLFITNRHVVKLYVEKIRKNKANPQKSTDRKILDFVYKKTGLKLSYFWVFDTDNSFAVIAGIPGFPQMFVSQYAYKNFNKDELDWLLLHETGHYILWHSPKELFEQMVFVALAIFLLSHISSLYLAFPASIVLAVAFGIVELQIEKYHEYEAEKYALKRLDNTKGMITAGEKSIERWRKRGLSEKSILHRIFDRWDITMFYKRISMAESKHQ